jgi:hypothetical protein
VSLLSDPYSSSDFKHAFIIRHAVGVYYSITILTLHYKLTISHYCIIIDQIKFINK